MRVTDFVPQIDSDRCNGCGLCVRKCDNQVLSLRDQVVIVSNPTACDYSAICQAVCPTQAIQLVYEVICREMEGKIRKSMTIYGQ